MIQKKKPTALSRLLNAPDKRINEAEDELTYIWRDMLRSRNITERGFSEGLDLWLTRNLNNGTIESKKRSSIRGNVVRALSEPKMTWKTFLRGLSILRVEGVRFQVDVHYPFGVVEKHETYSDSRSYDNYLNTADDSEKD